MAGTRENRYAGWTLCQLRNELRKRKLRMYGKKKDLIQRLETNEGNSVSCGDLVPQEYQMSLPSAGYKDLHGGMMEEFPQINHDRLLDYLKLYGKSLERKCIEMYYERYVRYIRSTKAVCGAHAQFFLMASVWAEMRKTVHYRVDVSFDKNGVVQEAQCECGAGQGPTAHCKHVACVIYAATCFKENGHVLTELTCTQVLQKYHHVKGHRGSPVKAAELQNIRGKHSLRFDPRPQEFRKHPAYRDQFRSTCCNCQSTSNLTFRQLFSPANIPAVAHDHDYLERTMEENFLHLINVTDISESQIAYIEKNTREQVKQQLWFEERRKRLTSSNFGSICKSTDSRDMDKLACNLISPSNFKTPACLHGIKYESVAAEKFESLTGIKTHKCGLFVCNSYPFLAASPDRVIDDTSVVEIKCPYTARDEMITSSTVTYLRTENNGSEQMVLDKNHNYYYQIQGQLMCSRRKKCYLVVHTFRDTKIIIVEYDANFIDAMLVKLNRFFENHFKNALVDVLLFKKYYSYEFES